MVKGKRTQIERLEQHQQAINRRASQRFRFKWNIIIRRIDETGKAFCNNGELNNLSSGGSHLILAQPLNVGDRIEICIKIPMGRGNWMKYSGEVIHLQGKGPGIMTGIKFDKSRPKFVQTQLVWN